MFCVVWDNGSSKLKDKQYKQKTLSKSYKTEIKVLALPGFNLLVTYLDFEQAGPGRYQDEILKTYSYFFCKAHFSQH